MRHHPDRPHPDRHAETLAQVPSLRAAAGPGPFDPPGPGSADARVDLTMLGFAADRAVAARGTDAARARLAAVDGPDLRAGTIRDGTARGVMVAFEEAISLCRPGSEEPAADEPAEPAATGEAADPRTLRRRRDFLVASAGARVRFSRRGGLLLVDREHGVHAEGCLRFEDRRDQGTLDGFEPVPGERPRLFSPAFLTPVAHVQGDRRDLLRLEGRLGRRRHGFPCVLELSGAKDRTWIDVSLAIHNSFCDHRLRVRFYGVGADHIAHRGTPGWEPVLAAGHTFLAATLVRACGRLRAGKTTYEVPAAQCIGWVRHRFRLGGPKTDDPEWARAAARG